VFKSPVHGTTKRPTTKPDHNRSYMDRGCSPSWFKSGVHLICRLVDEPQKTGLNWSTTRPLVYPKCFKKRQSTSDHLCILYGLSQEKPVSHVVMTHGFLSRKSCQHEVQGAHICNNLLDSRGMSSWERNPQSDFLDIKLLQK
jgi:hypothetical protein